LSDSAVVKTRRGEKPRFRPSSPRRGSLPSTAVAHKAALARPSAERRRSYPERSDSVVVQGVWCEPVSDPFPVMQGKYRKFSRIMGGSGPRKPYKGLIFLVLLVEFPRQWSREISRRNRESQNGNREFICKVGKPLRAATAELSIPPLSRSAASSGSAATWS
jgi:hypothetical protein